MGKQTEGDGATQAQIEQGWIEQAEAADWLQARERRVVRQPGWIYASMDGAHVPVEKEWRELKTLCWYDVEKTTTGEKKIESVK